MPTNRTCVFPGRFQPFHNGHGEALVHALSLYQRAIVAISNAHISHTDRDPFTGGERYEMIAAYASEQGIAERVTIVPIGIDDAPTTWVSTIRALSPRFDDVYTRSPWSEAHFAYWGIANSPELLKGHTVRASVIRELMAAGGDWRSDVPVAVANVIDC